MNSALIIFFIRSIDDFFNRILRLAVQNEIGPSDILADHPERHEDEPSQEKDEHGDRRPPFDDMIGDEIIHDIVQPVDKPYYRGNHPDEGGKPQRLDREPGDEFHEHENGFHETVVALPLVTLVVLHGDLGYIAAHLEDQPVNIRKGAPVFDDLIDDAPPDNLEWGEIDITRLHYDGLGDFAVEPASEVLPPRLLFPGEVRVADIVSFDDLFVQLRDIIRRVLKVVIHDHHIVP